MIRLLFTGLRFLKQYDVVKSLSFLQNLQDTIHYNSEYTILNLAFPGFEVFQNMFMLIFLARVMAISLLPPYSMVLITKGRSPFIETSRRK